jgi:hypothetical protein
MSPGGGAAIRMATVETMMVWTSVFLQKAILSAGRIDPATHIPATRRGPA